MVKINQNEVANGMANLRVISKYVDGSQPLMLLAFYNWSLLLITRCVGCLASHNRCDIIVVLAAAAKVIQYVVIRHT